MLFEELDYQETPLGKLILRRRSIPMLRDKVVHEVILNDEFLMSSLFHAAEDALAHLGLDAAPQRPLDVLVGGLGLGYTAAAALKHPRLHALLVIEFLEPVIQWHREGTVPLGETLCRDERLRFEAADFFARANNPAIGFDSAQPGRAFDAILLDIDHTPGHWLNPDHAAFYSAPGMAKLKENLRPDGVFALWSDAPADPQFTALLQQFFNTVESHSVSFPNPLTGGKSQNTVYTACS